MNIQRVASEKLKSHFSTSTFAGITLVGDGLAATLLDYTFMHIQTWTYFNAPKNSHTHTLTIERCHFSIEEWKLMFILYLSSYILLKNDVDAIKSQKQICRYDKIWITSLNFKNCTGLTEFHHSVVRVFVCCL